MNKSPKTRLKTEGRQNPARTTTRQRLIHEILDAGYVAHLAMVEDGEPVNIPVMYWRSGNDVYWHGSRKSRLMRASEGRPVCLTVTHFDGLVFAKSAFHHSANYRSVMVFGQAETVPPHEKDLRLHQLMERIAPGRDDALRPIRDNEFRATTLLRLSLDVASAKTRSGPPVEDPRDEAWRVWTGVVPCKSQFLDAVSVAGSEDSDSPPQHISDLRAQSL